MIVCVCRNVSDRTIAAAAQDGARDLDDVSLATGAGTVCGCCHGEIETLLARGARPAGAPCSGCRGCETK